VVSTVNTVNVPDAVLAEIAAATNRPLPTVGDVLQELWSGYGCIVRLHWPEHSYQPVILKLIQPPNRASHPRGWNTSASHERKLKSYQVEIAWYQQYANQCSDQCKVPALIASSSTGAQSWILLEDLNEHYPATTSNLTLQEVGVCLDWLANFHARFLHKPPTDLWPIGTYWHLDTRPDELHAMQNRQLKNKATELDAALNNCEYQTFVHGDAKVANFLFSSTKKETAAVDFQYVGGGVGIKDVAYFIGSCLDEETLSANEINLLDRYFVTLNEAITNTHSNREAQQVEIAWRELFSIAWTDFYRFLDGWMPQHKKIHRYTRALAERAFKQL